MDDNKTVIAQKWKRNISNNIELAISYYSILFSFNQLNVTERETQLVAFTSVNGNISDSEKRKGFCSDYQTTNPTINNMVSKLKKMGILTKSEGKIIVNISISPKFDTSSIILQVVLKNDGYKG